MVEFFGLSYSVGVPDGPSSAAMALPSTIIIPPPPLPAIGSAFMAGLGRTIVWRLPLPEDTAFCFSGAWRSEETKSPNTLARAVAGVSAPRTSSKDMRVAARRAVAPAKRAERAVLDDLYFITRGC